LPIKNGTFWVKISPKNAQDEVRPHFCVHNRVENLILIILEKKVKKIFIFDYFRAFLVIDTKKWSFSGINMLYTLYLDKEHELCLDVCFVGKLL
jgi:hypothetical protein